MSWSIPRTWATSETITSYYFNTHLRDQLLHFDTSVVHDLSSAYSYGIDDGPRRVLLYSKGYSSGGWNVGADTDTKVVYCRIPANSLTQLGDAILVRGMWYSTNASGTKAGKVSLNAGTTKSTLTSTTTTSIEEHVMELFIRYRTATTAAVQGVTTRFAGTLTAGTPYLQAATQTLTSTGWDLDLDLEFWARGPSSSTMALTDCTVELILNPGTGSAPS